MTSTPIVNQPNLYINNLNIVNFNSTSIAIKAGAARDSTNTNDIILPFDTTVSIVTNGANGLDVGTILTNTFYVVLVIGDSSNYHPVAGLLSLLTYSQPLIPTLPFGYDMYRRVGIILTQTVSSVIQPVTFLQMGMGSERTYYYNSAISVLSAGNATVFTPADLSAAVAIAYAGDGTNNAEAAFNLTYTSASAANQVDFGIASGSTAPIISRSNGAASTTVTPIWLPVRKSFGSQHPFISYRTTSASDSVSLSCAGFRDYV